MNPTTPTIPLDTVLVFAGYTKAEISDARRLLKPADLVALAVAEASDIGATVAVYVSDALRLARNAARVAYKRAVDVARALVEPLGAVVLGTVCRPSGRRAAVGGLVNGRPRATEGLLRREVVEAETIGAMLTKRERATRAALDRNAARVRS